MYTIIYTNRCTTHEPEKNTTGGYMSDQFITKVSLPRQLAESCWKLVDGEDATSLNAGVIRAIEEAHERSIRNSYGHASRI